MFNIEGARIFLAAGPTDMRMSILGLSYLVEAKYQQNPTDRNLYLFCNRDRNRLKILQYDVNGYWLYYKKLDLGKFAWPRNNRPTTMELTVKELKWLLHGVYLLDFEESKQALKRKSY